MILVFRALSAVFPVLVTLIVSARFDAQSAGAFFTAFSLVTFLSTILRLGVDDRILNICAAASELCEVMRPVVKTIWPILVGILLLVAFLYYYLPGNGNAVTVSFRALLPILFFQPVLVILSLVYQGLNSYLLSLLALSILAPTTFLATLIIAGSPVASAEEISRWMTAAYAFACTFLVLVTAIKYKPKTSNYSEKLRDHGGLLRKEQLYFFANAVSNTFWAQAPIFLAGIMVSASFSRDMAIVVRYCQILTIVVVVFNFTFAPVARRYFIENRSDELYDLWKSTAAKMILISAPVGVAMPFILISGYSSMLTASVEWKIVLFPWLVQMVINFFGPIGYLLIATERVKDLAYINTGFALIASLVLACFAKYINPFLFVYVIFGAYLLNKVVQYVYALYNVKLPSRLV